MLYLVESLYFVLDLAYGACRSATLRMYITARLITPSGLQNNAARECELSSKTLYNLLFTAGLPRHSRVLCQHRGPRGAGHRRHLVGAQHGRLRARAGLHAARLRAREVHASTASGIQLRVSTGLDLLYKVPECDSTLRKSFNLNYLRIHN